MTETDTPERRPGLLRGLDDADRRVLATGLIWIITGIVISASVGAGLGVGVLLFRLLAGV